MTREKLLDALGVFKATFFFFFSLLFFFRGIAKWLIILVRADTRSQVIACLVSRPSTVCTKQEAGAADISALFTLLVRLCATACTPSKAQLAKWGITFVST